MATITRSRPGDLDLLCVLWYPECCGTRIGPGAGCAAGRARALVGDLSAIASRLVATR